MDRESISGKLEQLIASLIKKGATAAEILHVTSHSREAVSSGLKIESLQYHQSHTIGLRVVQGLKQVTLSSSDLSEEALTQLATRAMERLAYASQDPHCVIARSQDLVKDIPDLERYDPTDVPIDQLAQAALALEEAAMSVKEVQGARLSMASTTKTQRTLLTSTGLSHTYETSEHALFIQPTAKRDGLMERDYDSSVTVFREDLETPEIVGKRAGERTAQRLGGKPVKSGAYPIIFDPRVSRELLSLFSQAINGVSIARQMSFLSEELGRKIFSDAITIIDDPHRKRGLRSKPFDGEGLPNKRQAIVEKGVLSTWFLDLATAKKLGLRTTAHASRSVTSLPSPAPTNLYIEKGKVTPQALMDDIKEGLYITETFGTGVNFITGDYSLGAFGYRIQNGVIAYPVHEFTLASNLKEMFLYMTPADDVEFRFGIDAPTLRVDSMTVAGRA